jgi:hypothetical protein
MLGRIKDVQRLVVYRISGSHNFHPFQDAHSLCNLVVALRDEIIPRDPSGMLALANALREHTTLDQFGWVDSYSRAQLEAAQMTALDPVPRALLPCPNLRKVIITTKCASADVTKNLLQLHLATELHLVLGTDHWLAVADEIRQGR